MNYNCTFKFYDVKGRRLSVFCRFINPMEAEIFTLTCSKQDHFVKQYAHNVYLAYLAGSDPKFEFHKPVIELVQIEPEQRELQTLIQYCQKNYCFYITIDCSVSVLVNEKDLNDE